jgi:hypothetical protein
VPLPQGEDAWLDLGIAAADRYVRDEGAVIWAEVEARLGETDWLHDVLDPTIPPGYGVNPHILHRARGLLQATERLVEERVILSGRPVTAWLDAVGLAARSSTRVRRTAAAKRRLYRTFLSWTGNPSLCGNVAERVVLTSLEALAGRCVWLPPALIAGQVRYLQGQPLPHGGPLDAAGHWARDPTRPTDGFVPFAVEVKNVRSWIYPWSHETWDLLGKVGAFPDVVPILIARRIHATTFRFFKDVGALGCATHRQWFASRGTVRANIDPDEFTRIRATFAFHDAVLLDDPQATSDHVITFFSRTLGRTSASSEQSLMDTQAEKWRVAAPIAEAYRDLSREDLADREDLWLEFAQEIADAGLYTVGGWAPTLEYDAE